MTHRFLLLLAGLFCGLSVTAQIGEYRNEFAVGVNGGVSMSTVAFTPEIPQNQLIGKTFGLTFRYNGEKYFKSICAIVAEINYAQIGWKENILTLQDQPVPLHTDPSQNLQYTRKMSYIQVPVLARLGWGRERKGFQGFFQVGPQVGFFLSDKSETIFDVRDPAFNPVSKDGVFVPEYQYAGIRASHVVAQDSMAIENKVDYGIVFAAGLEFSHRKMGHFLIEGRYYYGLGNMYGSTKRDYFGSSNFGNIIVKFTYLFDIIRTKNSNIK